jgi:hypothetical protein
MDIDSHQLSSYYYVGQADKMLKRLIRQDWEAIAGIIAAITALILHFLHYTDESLLLAIAIVLIALILLRDLKRESQIEKIASSLENLATLLNEIKDRTLPPSVSLIGPTELRSASSQFAQKGHGEAVWFNVCLRMFYAQEPFNVMLKPFVENSKVTSVRFVLDHSEKERWLTDVLPKIKACVGCDKVKEPYWSNIEGKVSFIMVETGDEGKSEALVSFWGEPFMAISTDKSVPRYIIHVKEGSELIPRLKEYERMSRLK